MTRFVFATVLAVAFAAPLAAQEKDGVPIFNGKDLTGWVVTRPRGGAVDNPWRVEEGALTVTGGTPHTYLLTTKEYSDYRLQFEYQQEKGGNSGLALRAAPGEYPTQMELVDDTAPRLAHVPTGQLYGDHAGIIAIKPTRPAKLKPSGEWNTVEVELRGQRVQVWLNGEPLQDTSLDKLIQMGSTFPDLKRKYGRIGFQQHTGTVRFRNVKITDGGTGRLPKEEDKEQGFVSLFNGKNLNGWKQHPNAKGDWQVEDGILIGKGPKFSHLFTERGDFQDVEVRVEARINAAGNSGVHLRMPFGATVGGGYEAQIDSGQRKWKTGSLFAKGGEATITIDERLVPPDTWFTLDHSVIGNRVVIKVNGKQVVDYVDPNRTHAVGHIALQQHNPNTVVHFRKVEARVLKTGTVVKNFPGHSRELPPLGKSKLLSSGLYPQEEEVLQLINEFRAMNGLPPRKANLAMCKVARRHSENMAKQDKLAHVLDGKGPTERAQAAGLKGGFGENCAGGGRDSVVSFFELWVGSPGHRANLLSNRAEMGVGFAISDGGNVHWYTAIFGDRQ